MSYRATDVLLMRQWSYQELLAAVEKLVAQVEGTTWGNIANRQLSRLVMLGVRHADGTPLSAYWPEATVTLEDVGALEARLGFRGTNTNQPREQYSS